MDSVGVRRFDAQGHVVGEDRFLGIFTTAVYSSHTPSIPVVRRKVRRVMERASFTPGSHDYKALGQVLESFPATSCSRSARRTSTASPLASCSCSSDSGWRSSCARTSSSASSPPSSSWPRDRYTAELREKLQAILERAFAGEVTAFYTSSADAALARILFIIRTQPGKIPRRRGQGARARARRRGAELARGPRRAARRAVARRGRRYRCSRLRRGVPTVYRDRFDSSEALADLQVTSGCSTAAATSTPASTAAPTCPPTSCA
jgi:glutamate dehydrogenase